MENRKLGAILLIVGVILVASTIMIKSREDALVHAMIEEQGSCFLEDGTCLHEDRNITLYIIVWIFSAALVALSLYILFFEKSQKEIISTLKKEKHIQSEEEKFNILLKGMDDDEKKVVKAVKEQDGITQQTLRLRTDLHKSKLSIVLDGLEKKGLIKRTAKGKTKQVFLKIKL